MPHHSQATPRPPAAERSKDGQELRLVALHAWRSPIGGQTAAPRPRRMEVRYESGAVGGFPSVRVGRIIESPFAFLRGLGGPDGHRAGRGSLLTPPNSRIELRADLTFQSAVASTQRWTC